MDDSDAFGPEVGSRQDGMASEEYGPARRAMRGEASMANNEESWHLDRRVPLAMIFAFVAQTLVLVYVGTTWKVEVESRLNVLEKFDERAQSQESRVIVVEQKPTFIADSVQRIEDALAKKP